MPSVEASWLGALGVDALPVTCAPCACGQVRGAVRVMPMPEIWTPAAYVPASGKLTVMVGVRCSLTLATTAVSRLAPLPMAMVWPLPKPRTSTTWITVAPARITARTVVAPGVPTFAMTAVSLSAPASMRIVWPASNPAHAVDGEFVAPAAEVTGMDVTGAVEKSLQLLSV